MDKPDAPVMKMVFRVGPVGFSMAIEHLAEVLEANRRDLDDGDAGPGSPDSGGFRLRGETLPLFDLARIFGLQDEGAQEEATVLVLRVGDDIWCTRVGSVEGVFPEGHFTTRHLPISLICSGQKLYSHLDLWRGEPLVCLEPDRIVRCRTDRSLQDGPLRSGG